MAPPVIGRGDFADVLDLGDGKVVKAFRREEHNGSGADWRDEDLLTEELFAAEVRAYEKLTTIPDLAFFAPEYFGTVDPHSLRVDPEIYVEGCGILLERIPGEAIKFGDLPPEIRDELLPLLRRFEKEVTAGDVRDCSCFIPGSRAEVALIDFAHWEHLNDCADILGQLGYFTEQQRRDIRATHTCQPIEGL
jgi:hypothetical protein